MSESAVLEAKYTITAIPATNKINIETEVKSQ
jgi:hypothetical protein